MKSADPELGRVARGASINFIGAISRNFSGFIFVFLLAKMLSAEEVGLFYLGANILMFAAIVAISGVDVGLRRYISIAYGHGDAKAAWDYFSTAAVLVFSLSMLLGVGLFVFADYLANAVFSKPQLADVIRLFSPYLVIYAFAELLLSVTQGYKQMKYWVLCLDVANSILRIVFAGFAFFIGWELYGVIAGYVLAILVSTAMAYKYFRQVMPQRPSEQREFRFRSLVTFSFPVALARLLNSGNGILETLLLGYFLTEIDVGVYTVALKIAVIANIILASFNTMFAPVISQLHSQGQMTELKRLFSCVTRWAFSLSLPVYLLVAWYSTPLSALFGEQYTMGAACVVILCLGQLVNAVTGPSGNILLMSGYALINLWTNLFGVVLSALLIALLVPSYGIDGCAFAVGAALAVTNVLRVLIAWRVLRIHPYSLAYWKPVLAGTIMVMAVGLLGPTRTAEISVVYLFFTSLLAVAGYGLLLLGFGLDESDRLVLARIKTKVGTA